LHQIAVTALAVIRPKWSLLSNDILVAKIVLLVAATVILSTIATYLQTSCAVRLTSVDYPQIEGKFTATRYKFKASPETVVEVVLS
jgi:hypothetical protein